MINVDALTYEQLCEIHCNLLMGGMGTFYSETGESWSNLYIYRDRYDHVLLYVELVVTLALIDKTVHREIISVDKNPELFDLYDFEQKTLVESEVRAFLDDMEDPLFIKPQAVKYLDDLEDQLLSNQKQWLWDQLGETVSKFADQTPLPTDSTH